MAWQTVEDRYMLIFLHAMFSNRRTGTVEKDCVSSSPCIKSGRMEETLVFYLNPAESSAIRESLQSDLKRTGVREVLLFTDGRRRKT